MLTIIVFLACIFFNAQLHIRIVLLLGSLLFYAYSGLEYLGLLIALILINYYASLWNGIHKRKAALAAIVTIDAAVIIFIKYLPFFLTSLGIDLTNSPSILRESVLPLGISFYTFQMIAYQIDRWRNSSPQPTDLIEFSLFVTWYPHLIAGPIMRGSELLHQFREIKFPSGLELSASAYRFGLGYFKKAVLVDYFLAPRVDALFGNLDKLNGVDALLAIFLFGFQIYYDFSGYCDMALGLAGMFGIKLRENFRTPYLSLNPAEFWNRWNITLSHWFRDYIYIPLGGSRRTWPRNAFNLLTTMLICGLWHGAANGFVVWGLYHAVLIIAYRVVRVVVPYPTGTIFKHFHNIIGWAATFACVQFGWLFFRKPSMAEAKVALDNILNLRSWSWDSQSFSLLYIIMALTIAHAIEELAIRHRRTLFDWWRRVPAPMRGVVYFIIGFISMPSVFALKTEPFIYFRF